MYMDDITDNLIQHKLSLLLKQLEELRMMIIFTHDMKYAREMTIISNTAISLENIRLFKLLYPST